MQTELKLKHSISVDCDGVLFDFLSLARKYFPNIPEHPALYSLSEYLLSDERMRYLIFAKSAYIIPEIQLYQGAMDFLVWVQNTFLNVYYITGRDKNQEKNTRKCFKELGLDNNKLLFEKEKHKVIADLGVLLTIEDDPSQLESLKRYKDLYLVVPERDWNRLWIQNNIGEARVYPYKDFTEATQRIEHILEMEAS